MSRGPAFRLMPLTYPESALGSHASAVARRDVATAVAWPDRARARNRSLDAGGEHAEIVGEGAVGVGGDASAQIGDRVAR